MRLNPAWVEYLMGCPPGWTDTLGPPLVDWTPDLGSLPESSSTTKADESS